MCDILETDDTVGDTGGAQDSDPAYLTGVISVGTAASLSVNAFDVDDAEGVTGYDTTLVERESVL